MKEELTEYSFENFPQTCHVCLIYENEEQRRKIVSKYLEAGIKKGELIKYFSDSTPPETIRSWLREIGVDFSEAEASGRFSILDASKAYCAEGSFDPQKMINGTIHRYDEAKKAGYTGSRACGEMSWALKGIPGSERLLEYELLLNTVNHPYPHKGMCQYDSRKFDGATLFKILQIHPYIIAQDQLVRNPYYIKPEDYQRIKQV